MREQGRNAFDNIDPECQEAYDIGKQKSIATRVNMPLEKYKTAGIPIFTPNHDVWNCDGKDKNKDPCKLNCCKDMTIMSFVLISDFEVLRWLCLHRLMDIECNHPGCKQDCFPVSLGGAKVGLKCSGCNFISKGGLRGFWSKGRLGITRMVAVVFAIVNGLSLKVVRNILGIDLNKNTWTKYVKDVGMVVAEALEKNRRDPRYHDDFIFYILYL